MLSGTSLYVPSAANRIGYITSVPGNGEGTIVGVKAKVGEGGGVEVSGKDVAVAIESVVGDERSAEGSGVRTSTWNVHAERLNSNSRNKNLYRILLLLELI